MNNHRDIPDEILDKMLPPKPPKEQEKLFDEKEHKELVRQKDPHTFYGIPFNKNKSPILVFLEEIKLKAGDFT